jgi:hypothetical protein
MRKIIPPIDIPLHNFSKHDTVNFHYRQIRNCLLCNTRSNQYYRESHETVQVVSCRPLVPEARFRSQASQYNDDDDYYDVVASVV